MILGMNPFVFFAVVIAGIYALGGIAGLPRRSRE